MPERIYLDSCVVNRPTDDQTQERIHAETLAIAQILDIAANGEIDWVASTLLQMELSRNPDPDKQSDSLALLSLASSIVSPTSSALA